jgi:hypothetical protein
VSAPSVTPQTPGPWFHLEEEDDRGVLRSYISGPDGEVVCLLPAESPDASLIESAPVMLALLRGVVDKLDGDLSEMVRMIIFEAGG